TCGANSVCLWHWSNPGTIRLVHRAEGHTEPIPVLAWSPDGRELASAADHSIRLWSFDPQEPVSVTPGAGLDVALTDLSASNDHRWLAAGAGDGKVHVWNLENLSPQASPPSEPGPEIRWIAWSPRAQAFATGQVDGQLAVRNWPNDPHPVRLAETIE